MKEKLQAVKLLIHAINGVGLGHVVRTKRIADALRQILPSVEIVFVTNTKYSDYLKKDYKTYILSKDTRGVLEGQYPYEEYLRYNTQAIIKIINHEIPDAVLFDCELNKDLLYFCKKNFINAIFVLRMTKSDRFLEIQKYLALFDSVIIPHEKADLPQNQQGYLTNISAHFVGPIVEQLSDFGKNIRKKILITLGSGAGIPDNRPLFEVVDSFLSYLRNHDYCINNVHMDIDIVAGPFYQGECNFDGFKVRQTSDNLIEDMLCSKIVISGAGYNTINEIVYSKTPAIVIPLSRGWDDQFQRAEVLERLGCIRVERGCIVNDIEDMLNDWEGFHQKFPSIKRGNLHAARIISQVVDQKVMSS